MKKFIINIINGIIFGISNVIPGVSGGTMAIIFNFYDILTESITLNFKVLKKNIKFIIPFGIGIILGIIVFSAIIDYLIGNHTQATYFGLIGIVLGSIPLILFKAKKAGKITTISYIPFIITLGIMVVLSIQPQDDTSGILFTTLNLESFIVLFLGLTIAAATMIIPGISGSLMLVIMGLYTTVIAEVIGNFNILLMIPVLLGIGFGLLAGAKLITILLRKYTQLTYMAIFGLVIGSIIPLWQETKFNYIMDMNIIISIISLVIMFIIVYSFSKYEINKDNKGE